MAKPPEKPTKPKRPPNPPQINSGVNTTGTRKVSNLRNHFEKLGDKKGNQLHNLKKITVIPNKNQNKKHEEIIQKAKDKDSFKKVPVKKPTIAPNQTHLKNTIIGGVEEQSKGVKTLINDFNELFKKPATVMPNPPELITSKVGNINIQPDTLTISEVPNKAVISMLNRNAIENAIKSDKHRLQQLLSQQSTHINPIDVFLEHLKNTANPAAATATTTLQQSTLPATLQPTKLPAISQATPPIAPAATKLLAPATPPPAPETPFKLSSDDIKRLNELTKKQQKTFLKNLRTEDEAKKLSSKIEKIKDDILYKNNPDKDPKKIKYNFLRDILGIDKDGAINTLKGFFPNILRLPEKSAKAKLEEFKKKLDELNDKSVDLTNKYEADIAEIKIILNDKDLTKPELKLKVAYHQKIRELKIKASTDLAAITNPTDNDILEKEAEDKKAEAQLEEEAVAYAQLKASNKGGSRHLKAQKHKSTKAQKHKSTKAQTHKHTNTQTQKHKSTKAQKHKITKAQKHKSTKTQKHKSTKTQKHKTYVNNIIL